MVCDHSIRGLEVLAHLLGDLDVVRRLRRAGRINMYVYVCIYIYIYIYIERERKM